MRSSRRMLPEAGEERSWVEALYVGVSDDSNVPPTMVYSVAEFSLLGLHAGGRQFATSGRT
jgi:hypothetical protein